MSITGTNDRALTPSRFDLLPHRQLSAEEVEQRIRVAEMATRAIGFDLTYVEFCEDADTPGLIGYMGGVTDFPRRRIKVATRDISRFTLMVRLTHELHHAMDPGWDCGNRAVI